MQFKTIVAAAAGAAVANAQTSICDKYTTALLKNNTAANQYTLLSLLVNTAVIGNFTGPGTSNPTLPGSMVKVPGILAPGTWGGEAVNLAPYFSGGLVSTNAGGVAVSKNFLDGGAAAPIIKNATSPGMAGSNQATLLTHLYQYFGYLLGCSQYGMGAFPSYAGDTSMYSVHRFMDLDEAEFSYFVEQVGLAAASFGAVSSDVTMVAMALNSTFGYKNSPAASVPKSASPALQAICAAADCPQASSPVTSGYAMETEPASASMMASGSMTMTGSMTASGTAMPTSFSAGAAATMIPAAVAGLAGLAAFAL